MTTPTTNTTDTTAAPLVMAADPLEAIAALYPTEDNLIAATTVYAEYEYGEIDTRPIFIVGMEKGNTVHRLFLTDMDKLATLYVENKKLVALMDKASGIKIMYPAKAKSGSGCAYVARNLD